jgi:hypothetical protein
MKTHWLVSVLVALAAFSSAAAQLTGWQLTAPSGDGYEASRDAGVTFDGKPTARLQTSVATADLGSLSQSINAEEYRGQRIRFTTTAKIKGVRAWTGAWMRIAGFNIPFRAYADTHDVDLQGDQDWTPLTIVMDVPEDARAIYLGLSQEGLGTSWFGPVSVETVDKSVPLSYNPGARNFETAPLACSKTAPTGSHIRRRVCYDFRTGRIAYRAIPEYVQGPVLSGSRVGTPRGWLWIWG